MTLWPTLLWNGDLPLDGPDPDFHLQSLDGELTYGFSLAIVDEAVGDSDFRPFTAQIQPDGSAVGYDTIDPEIGIFHEELSWHKGAGQVTVQRRGVDDHRYATANGVLTFYEGSVSTGYATIPVTIDFDGVTAPTGSAGRWFAKPTAIGEDLYASYGNLLLKWVQIPDVLEIATRQPEFKWMRVATLPYNIYTISYYKQRMYLAHGDAGYSHSTEENDHTAFTQVNSVAADFMAVVRNAAGTLSLGLVANNTYRQSTNPIVANTWAGDHAVGEPPETFTSLTAANNTVYVGTDRGLHIYDETAAGFRNIEPDAGILNDFDRYKVVLPRGGYLWATRGDESIWRISDEGTRATYVDVRNLFQYPSLINMTGIIDAMTQDSANIWIAMRPGAATRGFPYVFPVDFEEESLDVAARIMSLRDDGTPHMIARMDFDAIHQMVRNINAVSAHYTNFLIMGEKSDEPLCKRIAIPVDTDVPLNSIYKQCATDGYFTTPWIDFFYPASAKMLTKITFYATHVSPGSNIKIEYRHERDSEDDEEETWHELDAGETVIGLNEIYPPLTQEPDTAQLVFRRIRFKITLENEAFNPMAITSFVAQAVIVEEDIQEHVFFLKYSGDDDADGIIEKRAEIDELKASHPAGFVYLIPNPDRLPAMVSPGMDRRLVRIRKASDRYIGDETPRARAVRLELLQYDDRYIDEGES